MATVTDRTGCERWQRENAATPLREQPPTTVTTVVTADQSDFGELHALLDASGGSHPVRYENNAKRDMKAST